MTTWTIGEAAEKCGLSQHTLRWYERIGLLSPIQRGSDGGRRFSDRDLDWLSTVTKLRATGMPVRDNRFFEQVRRAIARQRDCLKLLDAKITHYGSCLEPCDKEHVHICAPPNSAISPCPPRAWAAWG